MDDVVKRGRGRPKKRDDNSERFEIRLSKDERAMLEHMEIESNKTKAEHIRKALRMYYNANYGRW
jgi:hypothetical protein